MEESEINEYLEERIKKIKKWFSNKYNLAFFGILVFALAIRLYYFSQTLHQPLWWDEAEYMNMARAWAFSLDYNFIPVRPVLFSFIIAGFLKLTQSEFLSRIFVLICSISSVAGMYYLGKEIYNKKIGLIASLFMSVFYLDLFFSFRLLVDTPSLTFFIFSSLFFYKYFKNKENKNLYIASVLIAIGTLFKLTTATLLFAVLIYVLFTEKFSFLKKKEYYLSALIFILILAPYIIWGYFQFNGFVITQAGAWNAPEGSKIINGFVNAKAYLSLFPTYLSWPLLIFFILGVCYISFRLILSLDMLSNEALPGLKKNLFLLLLFIFPLIIPSISVGHIENRYLLLSFPAVFAISGFFIMKTCNLIKKKNKALALILLMVLLVLVISFQIDSAQNLTKGKLNSYAEVRQAGIWLKENSEKTDIVFTSSVPQISYYSERESQNFPNSIEEFESSLSENPDIKYYIISVFENHPEWAYNYPQEKNIEVVQAYFSDSAKTKPTLVIYKLK